MLFEQAVIEYVDAKQFGRKPVRANTLEGYLSAIRCHLLPKWTGREIESITCDEIQSWVDSFERVGAAQKAYKTLRQLYRWYLRTYRVRIYDETQAVEVPTAPRRKPNALTAKQAKSALRDMRGTDFEPAALIQLSCGLRPCEAIALIEHVVGLVVEPMTLAANIVPLLATSMFCIAYALNGAT